jgi:hypothetical protein
MSRDSLSTLGILDSAVCPGVENVLVFYRGMGERARGRDERHPFWVSCNWNNEITSVAGTPSRLAIVS